MSIAILDTLKRGDPICVVWRDSVRNADWDSGPSFEEWLKNSYAEHVSVSMYFGHDDNMLAIVQSTAAYASNVHQSFGMGMAIPLVAVVSVEKLYDYDQHDPLRA